MAHDCEYETELRWIGRIVTATTKKQQQQPKKKKKKNGSRL